MKILITGGTGFLAGRLAYYLKDTGNYQVILGSRMCVNNNKLNSKFQIVQTIWNSEAELQLVCKGIDTIIHLAGVNASDSSMDPDQALEFNGKVTGKFLRAAVKSGVKKFIYFSTAHVYKSPLSGIINEDTLPKSLHPYATSNRAGEDMVLSAHNRNEIQGIVLRLSNSFGAPVSKDANCWTLLVNDLCKQVVTSGKMKLTSSGMQRRDFIAISDVCRVIEHLLKLSFAIKTNNLFNVGSNWSPTVWEMAGVISQMTKKILLFEPELIRKKPLSTEITEDLEYNTDRLKSTGFVMENNNLEEISNLLKFCKSNFSLYKNKKS